MAYSIKWLFEIDEHMVEFLLVIKVFLTTEYPEVKDLLSCSSFGSETCLLFCNNVFSLGFQSVQYYSEKDFAGVAN